MRFVQLSITLWVAVLVPVYYVNHGLFHFLWLSDVALFLTLAAVWRQSTLLFSATLLYALPFELAWNIDFLVELFTGFNLMGIADYMFDDGEPLHLRLISLFHVYMFAIWIWLLFRWGYHRRAFSYAVWLWLATIPLSYWLTDPERNINWVYSVRELGIEWMPEWLWPVMMMILVPVIIYPATHYLLKRYTREPAASRVFDSE